MPKYKIINLDEGHEHTHYEQAPDKETALQRFKAWHYGRVLECEEVKEPVKCPHCGKEVLLGKVS